MRALIWGVGLFALAVVTALATHYNTGYVLISLPNHRIEISLNLMVLLIALGCIAFHMLLNAAHGVLTLPAKARRFRQDWRRQQSAKALEEALDAYFESRHGRAVRAAARVSEASHNPLATVITARAAHEMREFQLRDDALARLESDRSGRDYLRLTTQAELLLDEHRYHDALNALAKITEKHAATLKLELRAHQLARNWEQILVLLPLLERRQLFSGEVLSRLRQHCHREILRNKSGDSAAIGDYLKRISEDDRQEESVALAAARACLSIDAREQAQGFIENSLSRRWAPKLLELYPDTVRQDARTHLERAEAWLKVQPKDAELLRALGRLCLGSTLWGKARSYFEASLSVDEQPRTHLELARLLDQLNDPGADAHYRRALSLMEKPA